MVLSLRGSTTGVLLIGVDVGERQTVNPPPPKMARHEARDRGRSLRITREAPTGNGHPNGHVNERSPDVIKSRTSEQI